MSTQSGFDLIAAVMAASNALLRESQRLFRPYGLTAAQYNVLNLLSDCPAGMSQRELGDLLVVDRSNVTGLLDRMEKEGWVRRDDDPKDRRIYRVSLTAAGRKLWMKVHPLYLEAIAEITRTFSSEQVRVSTRMVRSLETQVAQWRQPTRRQQAEH